MLLLWLLTPLAGKRDALGYQLSLCLVLGVTPHLSQHYCNALLAAPCPYIITHANVLLIVACTSSACQHY